MIQLENSLPPIPAKRYFTIGEVGDLCGVKPHVLRYWEQEFTQLKPMKRRGNRRYYQRHEVLMIRRIRDLLYDQGFTISGARNKLQELVHGERERRRQGEFMLEGVDIIEGQSLAPPDPAPADALDLAILGLTALPLEGIEIMRRELFEIRKLLNAEPEFAL